MGLAWDGDAELVVVEAQAAGEEPADESTMLEDVEDGPGRAAGADHLGRGARVRRAGPPGGLGRPAAVPAVRAAAGPAGHICPRQNGYRRASAA